MADMQTTIENMRNIDPVLQGFKHIMLDIENRNAPDPQMLTPLGKCIVAHMKAMGMAVYQPSKKHLTDFGREVLREIINREMSNHKHQEKPVKEKKVFEVPHFHTLHAIDNGGLVISGKDGVSVITDLIEHGAIEAIQSHEYRLTDFGHWLLDENVDVNVGYDIHSSKLMFDASTNPITAIVNARSKLKKAIRLLPKNESTKEIFELLSESVLSLKVSANSIQSSRQKIHEALEAIKTL